MYDHEEREKRKTVLLAQKLRRKKLRIRKEIPTKITHNELLKTRWNDI